MLLGPTAPWMVSGLQLDIIKQIEIVFYIKLQLHIVFTGSQVNEKMVRPHLE